MEELTILSNEEIEDLFTDTNDTQESSPDNKKEETQENKEETTEVNVDDLFTEPESVSSEDNKEEKESTTPKKEGTSPNNFYSSIATALRDSTFPDLDITDVNDADKFAESFEKLLQSRLDERQKRIDEALNNGVEPSEIQKYESTLSYLSNIKAEDLSREDQNSENLRKQLIYRDMLNRGYSQEEAQEEIKEIFDNGNDIKRAERALKSNISYFQGKYKDLIEDARAESAKEEQSRKAQAEALKKDMLSNDKAFGDLEVIQSNRQKAYDAITKPVYKDPDTGEYYTAVQKYEMEHRQEFLKNLGLLFVLTDNFTNLDNLIKGKVNKESKRAIRELENTLNNTHRTSDGNLNYVSGVSEDPESIFKGYTLDI